MDQWKITCNGKVCRSAEIPDEYNDATLIEVAKSYCDDYLNGMVIHKATVNRRKRKVNFLAWNPSLHPYDPNGHAILRVSND